MKRLKDNKFVVWKIFDGYNLGDPRKWTVLVNPGYHSIYITCYIDNESLKDEPVFVFDDGNAWGFPRDTRIQTHSMQYIINKLIDNGITPDSTAYKKATDDIR